MLYRILKQNSDPNIAWWIEGKILVLDTTLCAALSKQQVIAGRGKKILSS